jgi:hypothetical protein
MITGAPMHALTRSHIRDASQRPPPLAQVEVLLLFHPSLQGCFPRRVPVQACARATQGWLILDVYGDRGISEITGRPIMENLQLQAQGEDIEALLPDGIVNEVADYVLGEA